MYGNCALETFSRRREKSQSPAKVDDPCAASGVGQRHFREGL